MVSVSKGAPFWGTWWGHSFRRDFERRVRFFLSGELLLRNLRDIQKKALEMGDSLHMGPAGKPGRGLVHWDF